MISLQPVRSGVGVRRTPVPAARTAPAGQGLPYDLRKPPVIDPNAARTGASQDVSQVPQEPVDPGTPPVDTTQPDTTIVPDGGPMAFLTNPVTLFGYDVPTWALLAAGVVVVGGGGYALYMHSKAGKGGKHAKHNPTRGRSHRRAKRRAKR